MTLTARRPAVFFLTTPVVPDLNVLPEIALCYLEVALLI